MNIILLVIESFWISQVKLFAVSLVFFAVFFVLDVKFSSILASDIFMASLDVQLSTARMDENLASKTKTTAEKTRETVNQSTRRKIKDQFNQFEFYLKFSLR